MVSLRLALAACLGLVLAGSCQAAQPVAGTYVGLVGDKAYLLDLAAPNGTNAAGYFAVRGIDQQGQLHESSMRLVGVGNEGTDKLLLYPEEFVALPVMLTIHSSSAGLIVEGEGIGGSADRVDLVAGEASDLDRMIDVLRTSSQNTLASTAVVQGSNANSVDDAGCGCGEGKMARVAQATREFAVRADSLLTGISGVIAATGLHLKELSRMEARYRSAMTKAQTQLSGRASESVAAGQSALEVEAWHGAVVALSAAFERSQRSLDNSLKGAVEACQQRQPVPDAAMSPEIRQWSDTCARFKDAAPRYRAAVTEWESGFRALRELDRIAWLEWKHLAGQISNAE